MEPNNELAVELTVRTGGGLWSSNVTDVKVNRLAWSTRHGETFVKVFFDPASWDVHTDGLLYTDKAFKEGLKRAVLSLVERGLLPKELPWGRISYTEQGMQTAQYVHTILGAW